MYEAREFQPQQDEKLTSGVTTRNNTMSTDREDNLKVGEGLLKLWPGSKELQDFHAQEKATERKISNLYFKVPNHSFLSGIVEQWKSDIPSIAKGADVCWGVVAVSNVIEPLKTLLSVAAALEFRDQLPMTIITSQDLIMIEQRLVRKGIACQPKVENGIPVLTIGDYIALISFKELMKVGPEVLEGRGAVCFELDQEVLSNSSLRGEIAPLMLKLTGVYYMCRRLESRYAGLKQVRAILQGFGVPEKGILMDSE